MRRSGFTLLEIMLVLAVLVVIAALSMPALGRIAESQRLQQAADTVRVEWMSAHLRAMRSGRIQMFRYELGGDKFQVEPWFAAEDSVEAADASADPNAIADLPPDSYDLSIKQKQLPDGVLFVLGDAKIESRSQDAEEEATQTAGSEVAWSRPILFYPDGSTSTAFVYVANERKYGIRVDLRGLTGTVTVHERELLQ